MSMTHRFGWRGWMLIALAIGPGWAACGQYILSGTVTTSDGVVPYGIGVAMFLEGGGSGAVPQAYTTESGTFAISLAEGSYRVYADPYYCIYPPSDAYRMYRPEWFDDEFYYTDATPVVVGPGLVSTGLVIQLSRYAELRGRVVNATTLNPVSGVTVSAYETGDLQIGSRLSATTDAEGLYALYVNEGSWRIYANPEGLPYAPRYYSNKVDQASADLIVVALGQVVTSVDFALPEVTLGTIRGRVLGPAGQALAGATVYAYGDNYNGSATTDGQGYYQMTTLRADSYRVRASHFDYTPLQYWCGQWGQEFAHRIDLAAGQVVSNINFNLASPGKISGVATNLAGEPLSGLRIFAWSRSGANGSADTLEDGSYEMSGLPPGDYRVRADAENSYSYPEMQNYLSEYFDDVMEHNAATMVTITSAQAVAGIDFGLRRGGVVSGVVSNPVSGAKVSNVQVYAVPSGHDYFSPASTDMRTAYSADGGMYEIKGISPGTYRMQSQGVSYLSLAGAWYNDQRAFGDADIVDLVTTDRVEHIDVFVFSLATVSGRVTNASSTGLRDVSVHLLTTNGHEVSTGTAYANSSGYYGLRSVPAGTYVVMAIPLFYNESYSGNYAPAYYGGSSLATATRITVNAGDRITGINITLPTANGQISGRVTRAFDSAPMSNISMYAISAGVPALRMGSASTDGNGDYLMRGMAAGSYHVLAHINPSDGYQYQYYSNKLLRSQADAVVVGSTTVGNINFAIEEILPTSYVPGILAPLGELRDQPVVFTWKEASGARLYELVVDDLTMGDSNVIQQTAISGLAWNSTVALTANHDYRVRARGGNSAGYGEWGTWVPFHVLPPLQYALSITTVGAGSVTLDPPGDLYDPDTVVTLQAVEDGYPFDHWSGVDSSLFMSSAVVTMHMDRAVTAYFLSNRAPYQPLVLDPWDGAFVSLYPVLYASGFEDPDPADTHVASQWQVASEATGFTSPVYDALAGPYSLHAIVTNVLAYDDYLWRVRYQDSASAWSSWSEAGAFTTTLTLDDFYTPPDGNPEITWPTLDGYLYTLYACNDLAVQDWQAVEGYIDVPGSAGSITFELPSDEELPGFYRVEMRPAP